MQKRGIIWTYIWRRREARLLNENTIYYSENTNKELYLVLGYTKKDVLYEPTFEGILYAI